MPASLPAHAAPRLTLRPPLQAGGGGHHTVVGADVGQEMQFSVRTLAESSMSSYPGSVRLSEAMMPGTEPAEFRSHLASVDEGDIGRMPSPSFTSANTRMTENL